MALFSQYSGLRKENYVLFFGRIVTRFGSMVWAMLTLILSQKMGYSAYQISKVMFIMAVGNIFAGLLGGKLADKYNKKNCIIVCDIISVILYIVCSIIELSTLTIGLFIVAAISQNMEHPAYHALIADITATEDRERAYALQYLGINIGAMAAPTLAGFLLKNHLPLLFLCSGLAIGSSTVLIALLVKDITPVEEKSVPSYQLRQDGESVLSILGKNKLIIFFIAIVALVGAAYEQYTYLLPLDMGRLHGEEGSIIFGSVSSLNCLVVVIFSPLITKYCTKIHSAYKIFIGCGLQLLGYIVFLLFMGKIPTYYAAIFLFTLGEIFAILADGPYIANRIPASHLGRVNGILNVTRDLTGSFVMLIVGFLYDNVSTTSAWTLVISIMCVALALILVLGAKDKKIYNNLYKN